MPICVVGLWHLGSVTAACLAEHFETVGADPDGATVAGLNEGRPPIFEPGLSELVQAGMAAGRLRFTDRLADAVRDAELVWITFDTPVDENDVADVEFLANQVQALFPYLAADAMVLISSQVPVGFTASMERAFRESPSSESGRTVRFAYSPENLRLGKALDVFRRPERIVVGTRSEADRARLEGVLAPFCKTIEWMSVESAEMTKHALNAFLATSVTFINEVASICEAVGADAKEVERGLKGDVRIGPKAYLGPGGAFAGGTLARDIVFLNAVGQRFGLATPLLNSVRTSNDQHKEWPRRAIRACLGVSGIAGKTVALWGLTYKPDTDTLRRSEAVELGLWLAEQGATVRAFDPVVKQIPPETARAIELCDTAESASRGADLLVLGTEWSEFRDVKADDLVAWMKTPIVVDANRFLYSSLGRDGRVRYAAVGSPRKCDDASR